MDTIEPTAPPAPSPARWITLRPWISTAARLVLGAVWIVAGASKVTDLSGSVRAVRAYQLLPEGVAQVVGAGQPFLEIALGLLLVVGFGVRFGAIVSAVLFVVFIAGVASASARGLRIDCGCFGGGGALGKGQQTAYGLEIARDTGLLVLSALLAWWPAGRVSVDRWIYGTQEEGPR